MKISKKGRKKKKKTSLNTKNIAVVHRSIYGIHISKIQSEMTNRVNIDPSNFPLAVYFCLYFFANMNFYKILVLVNTVR